MSVAEMQSVEPRITAAVLKVLSCDAAVAMRTSFGGTAPDEVRAHIAEARTRFGLEDKTSHGASS